MIHQIHKMQQTSLKAWDEIQNKLGERQIIILKALKELTKIYGDATDWEIARYLGYFERNKVSPRRKELVDLKLLTSNGTRSCKVTGRTSIAWKPVGVNNAI